MIGALASWFRNLSGREQVLLLVAAYLLVGAGGGFIAYRSATQFRADAAADLASAGALAADVARLAAEPVAADMQPVQSDGTLRGLVMATAAQVGLKPSRIEPAGPTALLLAFEPAPAAAVLDWISRAEQNGLLATRVVLVRSGDGDIVTSDVTIGEPMR